MHGMASADTANFSTLEGEADCPDPAAVVFVKLRGGDLHTATGFEMQALGNVERADEQSGRKKNFFVAGQWAIHKKCGIGFEFRPEMFFDFELKSVVEDDTATEGVRAALWHGAGQIRLHIEAAPAPRPALGGGDHGRPNGVAFSERRSGGRKFATEEKADEVIAVAFGGGKGAEFQEYSDIAKTIGTRSSIEHIGRNADLHFHSCIGDDFEAFLRAVVIGPDSGGGKLIIGVEAKLLDEIDVSGDERRDVVGLFAARSVHGAEPAMHPVVFAVGRIVRVGGGAIAAGVEVV
jgi:hypothetical protein